MLLDHHVHLRLIEPEAMLDRVAASMIILLTSPYTWQPLFLPSRCVPSMSACSTGIDTSPDTDPSRQA
jgi:hypothetical protein